jgi:threonine dehydrogenase-like Zn-dependent dehydrogenase
VEQVLELTKGVGADKGCECVGYQCCDKHGTEHSNITMNELVQAVKATGSIGLLEFCSRILSQERTAEKDTWILTLVNSG